MGFSKYFRLKFWQDSRFSYIRQKYLKYYLKRQRILDSNRKSISNSLESFLKRQCISVRFDN